MTVSDKLREEMTARWNAMLLRIKAMPDDEFTEYLAQELYFYVHGCRMGQIWWDDLPEEPKHETDTRAKSVWRSVAKWAVTLTGRTQARPEL